MDNPCHLEGLAPRADALVKELTDAGRYASNGANTPLLQYGQLLQMIPASGELGSNSFYNQARDTLYV